MLVLENRVDLAKAGSARPHEQSGAGWRLWSAGCAAALLASLRQDPARASSIILTTVTDVFGFLSFLGIATLLASLL